jgi:cytidine deaminase
MTQPTSSELKISNTSETIQHLYQTACESRLRSHSPYSGKKVGAALLTTDQKIYFGCNVENSTYGATCCAERTAVQMGVATQGKITIDLIVVVTDATPA